MGKLDSKVALVTGASRGIGKEIAKLFAAEGARVVCTARTLAEGTHPLEGSLETTVAEIRAAGGEAQAVVCDVSEYDNCKQAVAETRRLYGPIDVLVNNAALTYFIPVAEFPVGKWLRSTAVNFHGPFFLSQLVLERHDPAPERRDRQHLERRGDWTRPRPLPRSADARRHALRRREGRARALHPGPRLRGLPARDLGDLLSARRRWWRLLASSITVWSRTPTTRAPSRPTSWPRPPSCSPPSRSTR